MRLFSVDENGSFSEYGEQTFGKHHDEATLEAWLEANPCAILDDEDLLVIGRQVSAGLGRRIDLLAIDRAGNIVVVEFKRGRTPRETLAQALEYAAFCASLEYDELERLLRGYTGEEGPTLSETHRRHFSLAEDEGTSFNKEQRIVLIAQEITADIRATARYLRRRRLPLTCIEFRYFQSSSGEEVLARETVVGVEPMGGGGPTTDTLPRTDERTFLEGVEEFARPVFEATLALADAPALIHWGQRGFSLNVEVEGRHVALCYGYPPASVYGQSLYTAFAEVERNVDGGSDLTEAFRKRFGDTGLFSPAGRAMKWRIETRPDAEQIASVTELLSDLGRAVHEHGLTQDGGPD
ncbi:MAG: hypothetical protein PVH68_12840 [Armatimonadota bacterium]|jgi:hypothetical protein